MAQVLDLDALLLLTGCLLHLAGVVIGTTIWGAYWVEADVGTVDVADTPNEQNKYPCYSKPSDYQSQKSKIMKTEILIKMRESLFWKRCFVCLAAGDKFIQGLKVRQQKNPTFALRQNAGPCIVILFKLGFRLIQFDTIANVFNFCKRKKKREAAPRAWLTNDVLLQRQEAINNERTVDNKAVHFNVVEKTAHTHIQFKLSGVEFIGDKIE